MILLVAGALYLPMQPATVSSQSGEVTGFYRNTTQGFSIRLPEGWVGQENEDADQLLSIQYEDGGLRVAAAVGIYERTDNSSAKTWLNAEIIQSGVLTTNRSIPYSVPGADSAHQMLTKLLADDEIVVITLVTAVARGSEIFLILVATTETF